MPNTTPLTTPPEFTRLYIFGAGGFGREVAWLAEQCWGDAVERILLVDRPDYLHGNVNGVPVHMLEDARGDGARFVVAVGDSAARKAITERCILQGLTPTSLIHPRTEMSRFNHIGAGSILCAKSAITTNVHVGNHVHINVGGTVGHDVYLADFTTVSAGAYIAGNVHVGEGAFIGMGANIINGHRDSPLVIGDGAIVAAGACVTRSVEAGSMVAGVPAVRKR